MKNLILIIIISTFTLSINAQSFEYKELVQLKDLSEKEKQDVLSMRGFKPVGEKVMTTRDISDTIGYSWVKEDEEVRFNKESVEYQWYGDKTYIKKKTAHKTVETNISWEIYASSKKYLKYKKTQGTYDADSLAAGKSTPSDYLYVVKEDFFTMIYFKEQIIFIGEIGGLVN